MNSVLKRKKDVVVVLPTGGGKSMLAIVPSLLEADAVTILVLPLNSLIMDYERRLLDMNVPHQTYQSNKELDTRHNLILVSADKSQTSHWRAALSDLARRKEIARIVVDEAHIPLIAKGYRTTLEHFYNIRSEPAPLVLLSATLPPAFMSRIFEMYHLLGDAIVCRQGTNRPELKYILEKTSKESELSLRAQEIVQQHQQSWQPQDRALVFAPSVGMCTDLACAWGWHRYVGDRETMTAAERQEAYRAWVDGRDSKVMVATSAFSTGNDYPHVRLVVHADKPFDMLEYVQGQGRAGRDGIPAVCHTLVPTKSWKESSKEDEIERSNEQAILDHLHLYGMKRCLRYGITLYVDGVGVGCHQDEQNQRCSVCSQDESHHPGEIRMASMPRHKTSTTEMMKAMDVPESFAKATEQVRELRARQEIGVLEMAERLQKELQSLLHTCCICLVHSSTGAMSRHELMRCPSLGERLHVTWSMYKEWRQGLQYRKHHSKICFVCHVPQINDSLHPTFTKTEKGGRITCEYADIVAPLAFAIYHSTAVKLRAETYFETKWSKLAIFTDWLMDAPKRGRNSNLIDLFLWYTEMDCSTNER